LLELPLIKITEVLPLIYDEFEEEIEIDEHLLDYAMNHSESAAEAAFIYADIYRSMDNGSVEDESIEEEDDVQNV
jgi:hypothetical protein